MTTVFGELMLFVQWSDEIFFSLGGVMDTQDWD